jgi:prophage DNA circulation protein
MATIRDLPSAWRQDLLPAHFDGRLFHVESGSRESGRRIVLHEFPKKDTPYAEDMGQKAISFAVRGYCIVYPSDEAGDITGVASLYQRDYRIARERLQERLETGKAGVLQLPTFKPLTVKCQRYRMTEEDKSGGYCVFDMQFVEAGLQPFTPKTDTGENIREQSNALKNQLLAMWAAQRAANGITGQRLGVFNIPVGEP